MINLEQQTHKDLEGLMELVDPASALLSGLASGWYFFAIFLYAFFNSSEANGTDSGNDGTVYDADYKVEDDNK